MLDIATTEQNLTLLNLDKFHLFNRGHRCHDCSNVKGHPEINLSRNVKESPAERNALLGSKAKYSSISNC